VLALLVALSCGAGPTAKDVFVLHECHRCHEIEGVAPPVPPKQFCCGLMKLKLLSPFKKLRNLQNLEPFREIYRNFSKNILKFKKKLKIF